ncbi:MAG: class I SAM-dependent methyltransferase, partial [Thiothrix sp.]
IHACREWYATPTGQGSLLHVQNLVGTLVADVFGYHALEIGILAGQHSLLSESRIAHQMAMSPLSGDTVSLHGHNEQLPFAAGNLDLVVASHVLDCSPQPHQVLRELERVLVPEGHCILIGFDPISFKGMAQLRHWFKAEQSACHFYPTFRVHDWLSLLGFEVLATRSIGFCPVVEKIRWLKRFGSRIHPLLGNLYLVHAKKKVSTRTPLLTTRRVQAVLRPGMAVNSGAGCVAFEEVRHGKS